ncbi:MAG: arginine--tRNA ligase [Chloroflexi bacterium HGW-Chloroflexi-10]|nr:MAG: arginine--tRNA ligase [Chloroflexi bacterium HGW-Chloroflexi-10]
MFDLEREQVEEKIQAFCQKNELPEIQLQWSWIPFSGHWGISTSLFALAAAEVRQKQLKINVPQRASELAEQAAAFLGLPAGFEKVEAVKGYLNLYFTQAEYARCVVDAVHEQGKDYGRLPSQHEQVMVEFSQPNTHKAFHVGHLRSAILGDTLSRILDFGGYDVVRANYPGDMGMHVIKWLWCYMNFHAGEKPESDFTKWMGGLYAEANKRLEENPELEADVRALYVRWDQRDLEVVRLWEETREWSLQGFYELYKTLDIHFDRYYFNSQMEKPGKVIVNQLIEKKIAQDERPEGAVIVKIDEVLGLEKEKYRVFVVLRSDGTALYATEDLALAKQKFEDYPQLKRSLYIVDVRQSLHFSQVFKTMEIAGYPWASQCQHIPYELVSLPGNVVMASREGTVVLLEDLIREATQRAYDVVQQKNPDLSEAQKRATASAVGIGAIKYPMQARENAKIVTFDWESALDFNGQAAPYMQYAYVRAGSILRKAGGAILDSILPDYEMAPAEVELIDIISRFSREVERAAKEYRPIQVANYTYDLAKAFNNFYSHCPVLQVEEPVRKARLRLVMATRQALANSLILLGITAPEAM